MNDSVRMVAENTENAANAAQEAYDEANSGQSRSGNRATCKAWHRKIDEGRTGHTQTRKTAIKLALLSTSFAVLLNKPTYWP